MTLDELWNVADEARGRRKLSGDASVFVTKTLPAKFGAFPDIDLPKNVRHPAGFTITGAPVGTFFRSSLLLAGQNVLGKRYDGSPFYEAVERDVAFGIMRSHFHHGYPKGTFCCAQCSLAVYPLLEAGAIRYFECRELASSLKRIIEKGEWRFARPPNAKMLAWSLGRG
jgi:hypothetical protein